MAWRDYIEANPEVKAGRPIVTGTRLTVDFVLGLVAEGWLLDDILAEYPAVTREGGAACLELAAETVARGRFFSLSVACAPGKSSPTPSAGFSSGTATVACPRPLQTDEILHR